jgi:hypothetical protein
MRHGDRWTLVRQDEFGDVDQKFGLGDDDDRTPVDLAPHTCRGFFDSTKKPRSFTPARLCFMRRTHQEEAHIGNCRQTMSFLRYIIDTKHCG